MMDDSMHYLMKVGNASYICINLGYLKDFMSYALAYGYIRKSILYNITLTPLVYR